MTRSEQLADAMILVAEADHYMVGLTETVTWDELTEAKDILITQQNSCSESAPYWRTLASNRLARSYGAAAAIRLAAAERAGRKPAR
jgi:hypothetical protein